MIYENGDIVRYENENCVVSSIKEESNRVLLIHLYGYGKSDLVDGVDVSQIELILKNNTKCPNCGNKFDLNSVDKYNYKMIICQWCKE